MTSENIRDKKLNSHSGGSQSCRCFKCMPNFKVPSLMAVDITMGTNPKQLRRKG